MKYVKTFFLTYSCFFVFSLFSGLFKLQVFVLFYNDAGYFYQRECLCCSFKAAVLDPVDQMRKNSLVMIRMSVESINMLSIRIHKLLFIHRFV